MRKKVALVIFTDGRWHCLRDTMLSFQQFVPYRFDHAILMNDFPNRAYQLQISRAITHFNNTPIQIVNNPERLGFCGTIARAWKEIIPATGADFIFHLEDDYQLSRLTLIEEMIAVIQAHPYLCQINLMRQPWNELEAAAGGIWQKDPDCYTPKTEWFDEFRKSLDWYEHRHHFSTNPCIYPSWVLDVGWPEESECEGKFAFRIWELGPEFRSSYWGKMSDQPWVTHTGKGRVGMGY